MKTDNNDNGATDDSTTWCYQHVPTFSTGTHSHDIKRKHPPTQWSLLCRGHNVRVTNRTLASWLDTVP